MTSATSSCSCALISIEQTGTDSIDQVSKSVDDFGWTHITGETVVYEAMTEIVRMGIFAYPNYDESCELIGPGTITIIFYRNIGEIRVILQPKNHSWPVRNEKIDKNKKFDYDGWLWRDDGRNRMCKSRNDLGHCEKERGFIFGDWNYYGVSFRTEDELLDLKNAIVDIQARMSNNSIPEPKLTSDNPHDRVSLRVSRFWCDTGLRMSNLNIVCINLGSVWRINGSYSLEHDRNGVIALTLRKDNPELLEMLVIFRCNNREETDDVKKCYRVPATLELVPSHITPENKDNFVWEWSIGHHVWACAFRNFQDGQSFKKIIDSHVGQLKKANKKIISTV